MPVANKATPKKPNQKGEPIPGRIKAQSTVDVAMVPNTFNMISEKGPFGKGGESKTWLTDSPQSRTSLRSFHQLQELRVAAARQGCLKNCRVEIPSHQLTRGTVRRPGGPGLDHLPFKGRRPKPVRFRVVWWVPLTSDYAQRIGGLHAHTYMPVKKVALSLSLSLSRGWWYILNS